MYVGILQCKCMYLCRLVGMCPQWSAVVGTNHHSDKMTTTTNSLANTKIRISMNENALVLLATLHKTKCLQGILDTI